MKTKIRSILLAAALIWTGWSATSAHAADVLHPYGPHEPIPSNPAR